MDDSLREAVLVGGSPAVFAARCCQIEDSVLRAWVPFAPWPEQVRFLQELRIRKQLIGLKGRQIGFTWAALADALFDMIFHPISTILIFSVGEREAQEALGHRLVGMYERLPAWLKELCPLARKPSLSLLELANGSRAMSFPASAGVSYTATTALIDEADKGDTDNLARLLGNVKPTVDAGGKLVVISTPDKRRPLSTFKNYYRAAMRGEGGFHPIFAPWSARPGRTQEWYASELAKHTAGMGSADAAHDWMTQEYPATAEEALAPSAAGARIPPLWLNQCYQEMRPVSVPGAPSIPGLAIYVPPDKGTQEPARYVIGGDPAKGNPHSDDSAAHVLRVDTGEEVAAFAGKHEMALFAQYLDALGCYYNNAALMVERNSLGEATLLWLREHSRLKVMPGLDGKPGWHTSEKSKAQAYATAADAFRNRETILHSPLTYGQLASIEGETLAAPAPLHDDRAMSYVLALVGVLALVKQGDGRIVLGPPCPEAAWLWNSPKGMFAPEIRGDFGEKVSVSEQIDRLTL